MHWYIHRRQYNGQWSAVSLIIQGICAPFSYSEIIYESGHSSDTAMCLFLFLLMEIQ